MRLLAIGIAAAALSAGAASAQTFSHPFIEIGAGQPQESDIDIGGTPEPAGVFLRPVITAGFEDVFGPIELRVDYLGSLRDFAETASGAFPIPDLGGSTVMISGVLNLRATDTITFYAGGGAGWVELDLNNDDPTFQGGITGSGSAMGWQAMGGVRARFAPTGASIFLEGRYQASEDVEIEGVAIEYQLQGVFGGLRWTF